MASTNQRPGGEIPDPPLALMAQADTELGCFDAQSANSSLSLLGYLDNRCLGLRVLFETLHVVRCPLTTDNLLHLLSSSHAMRSIRFRRGGAVSIARAFEQLTNQTDRNAER